MFLIDTTVIRHILATFLVDAHSALFVYTQEALFIKAINERSTVVAKGWLLEEVFFKCVRYVHSKPTTAGRLIERVLFLAILIAGTTSHYQLVAPLMADKCTHLALVALFSNAPNEILTVRAKCWLLQNGSHKSMVINEMDAAADGSAPLIK